MQCYSDDQLTLKADALDFMGDAANYDISLYDPDVPRNDYDPDKAKFHLKEAGLGSARRFMNSRPHSRPCRVTQEPSRVVRRLVILDNARARAVASATVQSSGECRLQHLG
jgi:hypothetical protein